MWTQECSPVKLAVSDDKSVRTVSMSVLRDICRSFLLEKHGVYSGKEAR